MIFFVIVDKIEDDIEDIPEELEKQVFVVQHPRENEMRSSMACFPSNMYKGDYETHSIKMKNLLKRSTK